MCGGAKAVRVFFCFLQICHVRLFRKKPYGIFERQNLGGNI